MPVLAVAAVSARLLAEAAAADGFEVVALDLFGDLDTRRAAAHWHSIGDAAGLALDPARTLAALRGLAARGDVLGWIAGSGFEGRPGLLAAGARLLPLLGTAARDVSRLRDPRIFFRCLRRHQLAHPPVAWQRPADAAGWLSKDAAGHGGWHIRPAERVVEAASAADAAAAGTGAGTGTDAAAAADADADADGRWRYFQRIAPGLPMSATFLADGDQVALLGINRLTVRPLATRPFVYRGVIGPLPDVPACVVAQVDRALRCLAGEFRLRGLGSLDFLLDGDTACWLEVNPRPPASLALYPGAVAGGLLAAHVRACRGAGTAAGSVGVATAPPPSAAAAPASKPSRDVRGTEIVFSPGRLCIDAAAAQAISQWPGSHDWPAAGTRFAAGDPLCSVSAAGEDAGAVGRALAASRAGLLRLIGATGGAADNDNRTETAR